MDHRAYEQHIEEGYRQFGFKLGYRHWYHPRSWVDRFPQVLVMPINPGFSENWASHGRYSQEKGSAYLVEDWGPNSLVRDPIPQILRMASLSIESVAYANWVPFRAKMEKDLTKHPDWSHINRWCVDLWRQLLAEIDPRLIMSFGNTPRKGLRKALGKPSDTLVDEIPGTCSFQLDHYPKLRLRVMSLPYPSSRLDLLSDPILPFTKKWMKQVARVIG